MRVQSRSPRSAEESREEQLALADDQLAVHFDGRAADSALEPERGLVVPAGEVIPTDSDRDRPSDDGSAGCGPYLVP